MLQRCGDGMRLLLWATGKIKHLERPRQNTMSSRMFLHDWSTANAACAALDGFDRLCTREELGRVDL